MNNDKLKAIILKITQNIHSTLRQIFSEYKDEGLTQLGKYNVNISNGKYIHNYGGNRSNYPRCPRKNVVVPK